MPAARSQSRSLKARALQWLAQREQSRVELRRKLLRQVRAELARAAVSGDADVLVTADDEGVTEQVDAVLDWLEVNGYLSAVRFVESRVNARSTRYGNLRIRQELQQHQLRLPSELAQTLVASEIDRAKAVRARRFAKTPDDATERARQARFLIGRGFSADAVQAALRSACAQSSGDDAAVAVPGD
jgi:regulatory protein